MSDPALGELIRDIEVVTRDAIHVAIAPMKAKHYFNAGNMFKLNTAGLAVECYDRVEAVGVVDPFLEDDIEEGDCFYGFLYPGTVTGMTHHWEHPAFDDVKPPSNEHEAWLRDFAVFNSIDYDHMISESSKLNGSLCFGSTNYLDDNEEFWMHLGQLHSRSYSSDHKESQYWRCGC